MNGRLLAEITKTDLAESSTCPKVKEPQKYRVILINDDYTPMDFVVGVLEHFFNMSIENAVKIMLQVHNQGKGECGVFTRDIAETKVSQVNDFSRVNQQPLLCGMEPLK